MDSYLAGSSSSKELHVHVRGISFNLGRQGRFEEGKLYFFRFVFNGCKIRSIRIVLGKYVKLNLTEKPPKQTKQ